MGQSAPPFVNHGQIAGRAWLTMLERIYETPQGKAQCLHGCKNAPGSDGGTFSPASSLVLLSCIE